MFRVALDGDKLLGEWGESLREHDRRALLSPLVRSLVARARRERATLSGLRIWHVSSTARGGGVAEMLPRVVHLLRELGVSCEWLVLSPPEALKSRFFSLTKHLHNNLHGDGVTLGAWSGCGLEGTLDGEAANLQCTVEMRDAGVAQLRALFEEVCAEAGRRFFEAFCPSPDPARDVVVVHDPQPAAIILALRARCPALRCVWRCHIGADFSNAATSSAWSFLLPYLCQYDSAIFSDVVYVPPALAARSTIIAPALAPLSAKNRDLSAFELTQILTRAGLMGYEQNRIVDSRDCELIDPAFADRAQIYRKVPSVACSVCEGVVRPEAGIPFLHRPIVTQVSRWDRLKGWTSLMRAWVLLKSDVKRFAASAELPQLQQPEVASDAGSSSIIASSTNGDESSGNGVGLHSPGGGADSLSVVPHDADRHARILRNAELVLAGPDPSSVSDDPEGLEVLEELKRLHDSLPPSIASSIHIVLLPMKSALENALMVNALQRASLVVVQNSSREGFGLTCAEAMFKRIAVVGTQQAVGLRKQIQHGVSGVLVQGSPSDPANVAAAINCLLGDDNLREAVAVNGQKSVVDYFLVYRQLRQWLDLSVEFRARATESGGNGSVLAEREAEVNDALADVAPD